MKKGFTLAEMIGVIVILAILALLIFPAIGSIIQKSKENTYNQQVDLIISSGDKWITTHSNQLSKVHPNCIAISTLKSSGDLKNEAILDPRDNKEMNGYIEYTFDTEYNQYKGTYKTTCTE